MLNLIDDNADEIPEGIDRKYEISVKHGVIKMIAYPYCSSRNLYYCQNAFSDSKSGL